MQVTKPYIFVRINKAFQEESSQKIGNIFIPEMAKYMKYNLQHGTITAIGVKAKEKYPYAEVGDIAIFKHYVESEDNRIVDLIPNESQPDIMDEIRIVRAVENRREILGIMKQNGQLIASEEYVFLSAAKENISLVETPTTNSTIFLEFLGMDWLDDKAIQEMIDNRTKDRDVLIESAEGMTDPNKFEEAYGAAERINLELEVLTKMIHDPKLVRATIEYINPTTALQTGLAPGDKIIVDHKSLYDLKFSGKEYKLVVTDYMLGKVL